MRYIAYKMVTHARHVGFVRFKDGNKHNFNKMNLERVNLNCILNDIIDKKNVTNWDIVLSEEERKYVEKNPNELARYVYDD